MKKGILFLGLLLAVGGPHAGAKDFDFAALQNKARELATRPYAAPVSRVPDWLAGYSYLQHQAIRFDPGHAWWRADRLPFQLQFFHPGWLFKEPVQIHEVSGGREKLIPFDPALFIYGGKPLPGPVPPDMGFAGLRLHYALNHPGVMDELAVFLGASYFRSLAQGLHYGLSARGLAINSGGPETEEFPRFSEYWIERPAVGAASIKVMALLDSPSVAGAFQFVITPGKETVMQVKTVLYFRQLPAVVGLAPLTSMFLHGEVNGWSRDDFRPEVHDSDGLLMHTGAGEWIWRPLNNPARTRASAFADQAPKGFGLLQRDREFAHYDDVEANYHLRPSAWVEPIGDWGQGSVRLVELHSPDETNDNIVAFWVPARLPAAGEPLAYEYRLHWLGSDEGRPPAGYVVATRQGAVLDHPERRRIVVDFARLPEAPSRSDIEAVVSVGEGARLIGVGAVNWIAPAGIWRAVFELAADGTGRPVELRCFLRRDKQTLTETWSHLWTP
jgi:periplasmic glucans biosynthesis protein